MAIDWNGHPPLPRRRIRLRRRVRILLRRHPNLYITSTTDGTHSPGSYHYSGRAVDFGSSSPTNGPEKKAMRTCVRRWGLGWTECYGPLTFYVRNRQRYSGTFPAHHDHLHIAL